MLFEKGGCVGIILVDFGVKLVWLMVFLNVLGCV